MKIPTVRNDTDRHRRGGGDEVHGSWTNNANYDYPHQSFFFQELISPVFFFSGNVALFPCIFYFFTLSLLVQL